MKRTILTNQFCQHDYDEEKKLLEQIWTNESKAMTITDFKAVMLDYADLFQQYDIDQVLVDSRQMQFLVVPEDQDWVNENIIAMIAPHLKKLGFLLSNDIFEEVAIRQAMEEQAAQLPFETKYFGDEQAAKAWLA